MHTLPPSNPITCLARNIYYESAAEPFAGKVAVGQVVLNRAHNRIDLVCATVYQRWRDGANRKIAAFSWTLGAKWRVAGPVDQKVYGQCVWIAYSLLYGGLHGVVGRDVMRYHAAYVNPGWSARRFVMRIGNHMFYRGE